MALRLEARHLAVAERCSKSSPRRFPPTAHRSSPALRRWNGGGPSVAPRGLRSQAIEGGCRDMICFAFCRAEQSEGPSQLADRFNAGGKCVGPSSGKMRPPRDD
jgi:hypothetical protein